MKVQKNLLVAPLNWGIGHATRCIPIIEILKENGFNVIIATSGRSLDLLLKEFPNNEFIKLEDYNVKYHSYLPMSINMFIQIPKILLGIHKERKHLKSIIKDFKIKGVISDNRYGLYSKEIPSIFITHQLGIQTPIFKNIIKKINYLFINKFTQCWIPDYKENGLAGKLSHPKEKIKNHIYIGPLSRFKRTIQENKFDILAILSGPEPQRSIFEKILIKKLRLHKKKVLLLQGKPDTDFSKKINNLTIRSHMSSEDLNTMILQSNLIICRSGYSTIMDLVKLQKNAILVPTPGQTEQEYLAQFLSKSKHFQFQNQKEFNLSTAQIQSNNFVAMNYQDHITNWDDILKIFKK
ncbi:MAG: glycosyltransferase family protein [Flavobacteriales bacterium]|nr:glycosyltransferase family protein [Flavobacteriales bacterium]